MTYVYQEYPKMKYHKTLPHRIVKNAEEEKALGPDWLKRPYMPPPPTPTAEPKMPWKWLATKRSWWEQWSWCFAAGGTVVAILGGIVTIVKAIR